DAEVELTLFRVSQEAMSNVHKHTGQTRVRVRLKRRGNSVRLEVQAWGAGFNVRAVQLAVHGEYVGLTSMRERMQLIGGQLDIRSSAGRRTTVRATLPLPNGASMGG
ncbi:MAG: sensor histidine kinase, partial [Chloroflexi bacterium]|nr:sensor histidine kinase [Chloroflexota bacterium]